jgi:hypothetical protein
MHTLHYVKTYRTNDELDNLIKGRTMVNFIKAQRVSWLGHISRMEAERTATCQKKESTAQD